MFFKKLIPASQIEISLDKNGTTNWWCIIKFNSYDTGLHFLESLDTGKHRGLILQSGNFYFKTDTFFVYYASGKFNVSFILPKGSYAAWGDEIINKTCKVFLAG